MNKKPYKPFWDSIRVPVYAKDPDDDLRYVIWNAECAELYGITAEEILGKTDFEIFPLEVAAKKRKFDEILMREKQPILNREEKIWNFQQEEILIKKQHMIHFKPEGNLDILITVMEDVSLARRKEKRQNFILEKAEMGFWEWDLVTNELLWENAMYPLYGIPKEKSVNYDLWWSLVHEEDKENILQSVENSLKHNAPYDLMFRIHHQEKGIRWISTKAYFEQDDKGTKTRMIGVNRDLTNYIEVMEELKGTQKNLISLQEKNRIALDSVGLGVWEWNLSDNKLNWDQTMFEICGVNPKDFKHDFSDWSNCLIPEDLVSVTPILQESMQGKRPLDIEFRIQHPLKGLRHIKGMGKVLFNENGTAYKIIGLNQDITEKKLMEANHEIQQNKLRHNSHLAALGEVSSSIAHEINNPLTIISGMASIIEVFIEEDPIKNKDKIVDKLHKIVATVGRTAKIVKSMKSLSRNHEHESLEQVDFRKIVDECKVLVKEFLMKHEVELYNDLPPELPMVEVRPNQIMQVLVNLLTNAVDAQAALPQEKRWIKVRLDDRHHSEYILIQIIDGGMGISPTIQDKIMQPFFSTKGNSSTGLG
ncbi:MAG: PAS domain-containing protein, partial [Bacteriovoracaceae bacterium]|nr:PAS domain-containing protein [Bacteriovoracaceae bacterium]